MSSGRWDLVQFHTTLPSQFHNLMKLSGLPHYKAYNKCFCNTRLKLFSVLPKVTFFIYALLLLFASNIVHEKEIRNTSHRFWTAKTIEKENFFKMQSKYRFWDAVSRAGVGLTLVFITRIMRGQAWMHIGLPVACFSSGPHQLSSGFSQLTLIFHWPSIFKTYLFVSTSRSYPAS